MTNAANSRTAMAVMMLVLLAITYPNLMPSLWFCGLNELLIIVAIYIASATDRMRVEIDGLAAHMYRYKRV